MPGKIQDTQLNLNFRKTSVWAFVLLKTDNSIQYRGGEGIIYFKWGEGEEESLVTRY